MANYTVTLADGELWEDGVAKFIQCPSNGENIDGIIVHNASGTTLGTFVLVDANGAATKGISGVWAAGQYIYVRFDTTNKKAQLLNAAISQAVLDKINAITPADIDALALSGGTLTGNLVIEKSSVPLLRVKATNLGRYCETRVDSGGNVLITNRADDSNFRGLVINQESGSLINAVQLGQKINDAWSGYNILHTGNKPSGSYTGNGSEATRTIALGGIASGAVLIKNGTNGRDAIVMNAGAIVSRSGTLIGHAYSAVRFKDNALILNTADTDFNANGITYNYWVL